jgi:hypothetical protein
VALMFDTVSRRSRRMVDKEEVSVTGSAGGLSKASGTLYYDECAIEVETAPIRLWLDGTDPTSAAGHFCLPGHGHVLTPSEAAKLRAIRATVNNGLLRAVYYSWV